jgi:hypothetical protein
MTCRPLLRTRQPYPDNKHSYPKTFMLTDRGGSARTVITLTLQLLLKLSTSGARHGTFPVLLEYRYFICFATYLLRAWKPNSKTTMSSILPATSSSSNPKSWPVTQGKSRSSPINIGRARPAINFEWILDLLDAEP